jgi:hypothetical protein
MQNLKLVHKIILANIAISLLFAIYYAVTQAPGQASEFALAFGVICLLVGIADLFVSLILFMASSGEWSKGFLFSGGILLLLSGITCGIGAGM